MKAFNKLIHLLLLEKSRIKQIYVFVILQSVFYLSIPLGIQAVITYTMAGEISASLMLLCFLTIMSIVFVGLFQLWQMRINETVQQGILLNVGLRFADKLSKLKPELYLSEYLPSRINHFFDVLTLQKGLSKLLLEVSFSFISIAFGLLVLPFYSPMFLIFSAFTILLFYFIIKVYGKRALNTSLKESKKKYLFVDWFQKLILKIKTHPSDVTEEYIVNNTNEYLGNYIDEKSAHFKVLDVQYKSILIFKIIFSAILLFLGVWFVQIGVLNIGQFVASEVIVILIINSVEKLVISLDTVYDVLTATEKLEQVFELEETKENHFLIKEASYEQILKPSLQSKLYNHAYSKKIQRFVYAIFIIGGIVLFLPWTQTVDSEGRVTTLNPSSRPQVITSRIAGRVESWYIKEGDFVNKNDTIAFISEIKEEYIDPLLVDRSEAQVKSKESTVKSYEQKINAIDEQIDALEKGQRLKTEQVKNKYIQAKAKISIDSAEMAASANNYKVVEEQFKRFEELLIKGVVSKTDLENRKIKVQEALAKKISAENKYSNARNELLNVGIELNSIEQEYNEKLMKAESDKYTALSLFYEGEAAVTKLQNQLSNYSIRRSYYYVLAPQDGFITKTYVQGIGEIVKEGAPICSVVPNNSEQAVELYIKPIDLPLMNKHQKVQLVFDGWPAFVFSGWPGVSFGTYSAEIIAIDKVISDNGKFRVLAINKGEKWPAAIQIGGGVKGFALLNNVMVIYELWRKVNGFPPEFYTPKEKTTTQKEHVK